MIHFFKRKYLLNYGLWLLLFVCIQNNMQAQVSSSSDGTCPPKTFFELLKKKDSLMVVKPIKNSFLLVIPIIGVQPATGFSYGATAQYTFKGGDLLDKYSSANLGVVFTTKDQLLINAKNNILLKDNKIYLSGDYRLYVFTQPNYGLGTHIIPTHKEDPDFDIESIAEPMDYNYFKFHQTISWEVKKHFYVGAGIEIDWYSAIMDKNVDVDNGKFTNHYNYSKQYGFGDTEYFVNGLSLNLIYDSRDNQINTSEGWFANVNYRFNADLFNEQESSSVLYTEFRYFIPLSPKKKQFVLGIWAFGQFVTNGVVPYLNLPAIGWDQRSRSGEGYTQGLFRGNNLAYLQTELRFPISCNQLLSGTVFANFTTASDKLSDISLFQYVQPAVGVGLRILIDKATRTNLILDYAVGNRSQGFYLNAGETF
ncbi:BamA/TamA family outer membrane protein [Flavobacterium sp. ZT3R18]|uniref:BamA/TamA family outer membrane protein n=1 Tax=Flavobacterium sp. ZT3R18 TaxID=2594429 RepID=UPI00117A4BE4|nr:BamA/TamA family outer membrane protein [Flavobacterium sp. ZT3R18]TRX37245.1 BamA/TamA family outer membrane protein [Flavobacterium sp. ZT3R18]